jgi:phage-related protein
LTNNFYGNSFIYDGIQSEVYDLRIFAFDSSNPSSGTAGGESSIYEKWLYRKEKPYFYGRYFQTPLEFDLTVGSFNYIDGITRNAIESWLLSSATYKPLRIVEDDIAENVFNAIITRSTHQFVGNLAYALTIHVRCDSPFAEYTPPVLTKIYADAIMSDSFVYINSSVYNGYNRPTITFTMGSTPTYFSLINTSDSSREFRFDNLTAGETITVDNDKGIITSSLGSSTLRLNKFNKNFFRLVQGVNSLVLTGYITNFTLSTKFAKAIGA